MKALNKQKQKPLLQEKAGQTPVYLKGEKSSTNVFCSVQLFVEYEFICEMLQNDKN